MSEDIHDSVKLTKHIYKIELSTVHLLYSCLSLSQYVRVVNKFKYLGTTLTNKNAIKEEIKSRLRSGNACYYSVQNLLSSRLVAIKKFRDQDI
jgi:hypothetical protein